MFGNHLDGHVVSTLSRMSTTGLLTDLLSETEEYCCSMKYVGASGRDSNAFVIGVGKSLNQTTFKLVGFNRESGCRARGLGEGWGSQEGMNSWSNRTDKDLYVSIV